MKIFSNISFGKKLKATCQVKTDSGEAKPCQIYELNKKDDIDYFCKLKKSKEWSNGEYLEITNQMMLSPLTNRGLRTYSLETKEDGCIGYISTHDFDFIKDKTYVEFLETCPQYTSENKRREIKYIGQTLLAFVVGLADKEDKTRVCISSTAPKSRKFYTKGCGFRQDYNGKDGLILNSQSYEKFLNRHKENTGKEIEFIA